MKKLKLTEMNKQESLSKNELSELRGGQEAIADAGLFKCSCCCCGSCERRDNRRATCRCDAQLY